MSNLNKLQLDSSEVAFVIKKEEDTSNIGVYIPTLMSEIDMGERVWDKKVTTNSSFLKNSNIKMTFEPITLCNYINISHYDPSLYYTDKELGEQVRIKFLDNDLKKCVYYDDSYKMTDALMDKMLLMQEQLDLMNKQMEKLEGMIQNDSE